MLGSIHDSICATSHPTNHQDSPRLQHLGRRRNAGRLRAALHAAQFPQVVGNARRQHRFRRRLLSRTGSRWRHHAGRCRLRQRLLGHPRHRPDHFPDRPADQLHRRQTRPRHGSVDARRRLRLHRLDHHLTDLRFVHLHLLRPRSGDHGLCAGAGLRHPAGLGLSDLRAGRHPAGHPWRHRDQQTAGVDAAVVDLPAGAALRLRLHRGARGTGRSLAIRRRARRRRRLRPAPVRRRADRRHRAGHADGRTGRLPALHAGKNRRQRSPLVVRRHRRRAGLGRARHPQDARWCPARLAGAAQRNCPRKGGRPQPDVPDRLLARLRQHDPGDRRHRPFRRRLAAQDQRHQRLCRLAGLVQLLRPPDAQPSGARRLGRLQHADRAAADGTERLPGARPGARPLFQHRHLVDGGGRRRPRHQQAARSGAAGHRVQAQQPLRHQPGRRRRHGGRLAALDRRLCRPARRRIAALRLVRRVGQRAAGFAADRLGHRRPLLPGAATGACCGQRPKMCNLRTRLRRRGHGALPRLPGADLLAVLLPRCPLPRPVQARSQPYRPVERRPASPASGLRPALSGNRPRPLPAADDRHRAGAGAGARRAVHP